MTTPPSDIRRMLAETPFLHGLDDRHLDRLASIASILDFPKESLLCKQNAPAKHCYVIQSGEVGLEVYDSGQGPRTVETLGPGSVLGWSWLVEPHTWWFDGRALEPTTVIALNAEGLRAAMEDDHELGYRMLTRFLEVFTERLSHARLQLLDLYAPSPKAHP